MSMMNLSDETPRFYCQYCECDYNLVHVVVGGSRSCERLRQRCQRCYYSQLVDVGTEVVQVALTQCYHSPAHSCIMSLESSDDRDVRRFVQ